jgi:glycosyltransferase involved in cell wall biosynthesis
VLDSPTDETTAVVNNIDVPDFRSTIVSFRDLGKSRNAGIQAARGQWIGFLDGDDLWSENWLRAAYEMALVHDPQTIFHPHANIYFGAFYQLFMHVDMDDPDFDVLNLSVSNYWTSLTFAKRETHLAIPYPRTDHQQQIGY